jgi:hypothetical protein
MWDAATGFNYWDSTVNKSIQGHLPPPLIGSRKIRIVFFTGRREQLGEQYSARLIRLIALAGTKITSSEVVIVFL